MNPFNTREAILLDRLEMHRTFLASYEKMAVLPFVRERPRLLGSLMGNIFKHHESVEKILRELNSLSGLKETTTPVLYAHVLGTEKLAETAKSLASELTRKAKELRQAYVDPSSEELEPSFLLMLLTTFPAYQPSEEKDAYVRRCKRQNYVKKVFLPEWNDHVLIVTRLGAQRAGK
jgi:hypothetical protein